MAAHVFFDFQLCVTITYNTEVSNS